MPAIRFLAVAGLALAAGLAQAGPASADEFEFVAAPQTDLNRIYRVDRVTGEVGACQYGLKEGSVGVTLCYPSGEGAGRQEPGSYGLVASRHEREGGVFRVDRRSGAMSICYVFNDQVVCTPSEKGAIAATARTPAPAAPGAEQGQSSQATGAVKRN